MAFSFIIIGCLFELDYVDCMIVPSPSCVFIVTRVGIVSLMTTCMGSLLSADWSLYVSY